MAWDLEEILYPEGRPGYEPSRVTQGAMRDYPVAKPPAPTTPEAPAEPASPSSGESAGGNNMGAWGDYLGWQRKNIKQLISQYRDMFPKFLKGWKSDAYSDLTEATHDYGEGSLVNLWKRGLGKSPAWVAGSKLDTAGFQESGARDIEAMGQQMQMDSISKLAAAVGRPDQNFANVAGLYNSWQSQQNQVSQQNWQNQFMMDQLQSYYSNPEQYYG